MHLCFFRKMKCTYMMHLGKHTISAMAVRENPCFRRETSFASGPSLPLVNRKSRFPSLSFFLCEVVFPCSLSSIHDTHHTFGVIFWYNVGETISKWEKHALRRQGEDFRGNLVHMSLIASCFESKSSKNGCAIAFLI